MNRAVLCAVVGLFPLACGGTGGTNPPPAPTPTPSTSTSASDPLFDQSRLHDIRLSTDPLNWTELRANYSTDAYYVADVTIEGQIWRQIGIRSRGQGSRNQDKPALSLDFDKYVSDQHYGVYNTIVLRNLVQDPSCLRERLSFAVFEAMGISTPQTSFARLYVNDEYWGLYEVVEPIRKPFLKARLGEDSGNLFSYEYTFVWDFSFLGNDPSAYIPVPFKPHTNEKTLDATALVDFISAINGASAASFTNDMGAWLDRERFLTSLAVENAIAEQDGFLGQFGMNNFYLYQYAGQRRFVFLPWDYKIAFIVPNQPILLRVETNVLARRLLSDPAMRQTYVSALRKAVTSFVNSRWLTPRLDQAYAQIRDAARADPHKPYTSDEFELAVGGVRGIIAARESDVLAQIGGS